jgi:hypothetical protein
MHMGSIHHSADNIIEKWEEGLYEPLQWNELLNIYHELISLQIKDKIQSAFRKQYKNKNET